MDTLIEVLSIALALALLWLGITRLEVSTRVKGVLYFLEVGWLLASVVTAGRRGFVVFVVANLLGFGAWAIHRAEQKERMLLDAATQTGATKQEMFDLHRDLMTEHVVFMAIGEHKVAQFIRQLAQRNRSAEEIKLMTLPIALLWDVHRSEMNGFVERFDRLLRLYDEPAERAMAVADILTTSTSTAADPFDQMLDALIQGKE